MGWPLWKARPRRKPGQNTRGAKLPEARSIVPRWPVPEFNKVFGSNCKHSERMNAVVYLLGPARNGRLFLDHALHQARRTERWNFHFSWAITLKALGFPTEMFTVLFAIARTAGWIAHWKEMIDDPSQRIGRRVSSILVPPTAPSDGSSMLVVV